MRAFREHALVGGGWRADGGASLTTYFLGACLTVFPNEFRKYRSQRQRWQAQDDSGHKAAGWRADATGDPADLIAGTMRVREDLARMDPRTRAIVALRMDGYRQEEIAEMLGEPPSVLLRECCTGCGSGRPSSAAKEVTDQMAQTGAEEVDALIEQSSLGMPGPG